MINRKTQCFAHRGFSGRYPENTLLAFEKAMESGADGIELDVQLSKDGEVVIIHDERLDRTTNGSGWVKQFELKDLKQLNAGNGEQIPTLKEYFELIKGRSIRTNIELKNSVISYDGMEEKVLEIIEYYNQRENIILSSFNHNSMIKMKKIDPDLEYGILEESCLVHPEQYLKNIGVYCYHPEYHMLSKEKIAVLKKNGIKIHAWTVNSREGMENLIAEEIEIVITNYPDLFIRILHDSK